MATGFRNLAVYKKAFALAMDIYHVSKKFPKDELYSLTSTRVWLDFGLACEYITKEIFDDFNKRSEEIGRLLNHMIQYPEKYK